MVDAGPGAGAGATRRRRRDDADAAAQLDVPAAAPPPTSVADISAFYLVLPSFPRLTMLLGVLLD